RWKKASFSRASPNRNCSTRNCCRIAGRWCAAVKRMRPRSRRVRMRESRGSVRMATSKKPKQPQVWKLRLFVAGETPKSIRALANLKRLCEARLKGRYQIEVIDLLEQPH